MLSKGRKASPRLLNDPSQDNAEDECQQSSEIMRSRMMVVPQCGSWDSFVLLVHRGAISIVIAAICIA